jgi:hypothetical protein
MTRLLVAAFTLAAAAAAWGGLGWLALNVPPSRPFALLAGYAFGFAAITGTVALLGWLIVGRGRGSPAAFIPHAMLLGVLVLFAVWLQALRMLTPIVAVLLVGLYIIIELAVLFGTRGSVELPVRQ